MATRRKGESDEAFRARNRKQVAESRAKKRKREGKPPKPPKGKPGRPPAPRGPGTGADRAGMVDRLEGVMAKAVAAAEAADFGKQKPPDIARTLATVQRAYYDALEQEANSRTGILARTGPPRSVEEAMARLGMDGRSWRAWTALSRLVDGSELDAQDREIINARTGLVDPPKDPVREVWGVCGRRAGKSAWAAVAAVVWACRAYPMATDPVVLIVARTTQQARVVAGYARTAAEQLGVLDGKGSAEVIPVRGGVKVRVSPNTASVRGVTAVAAVMDEVAHYHTGADAAWSDTDLLTALRPALATVRSPLLVGISSPWKRRGILADAWREWQDGDRPRGRVVWHGPSKLMNPTLTQAAIDADIAAHPAIAAEYSADFFADGGAWLPPSLLTDEIVADLPKHRNPTRGSERFAFVDAASGGGSDSVALAVAERLPPELDGWGEVKDGPPTARLLFVREWRPKFSLEKVIVEAAADIRRYGLERVTGDAWAQGAQAALWRQQGVAYMDTAIPKSDIYHAVLPGLMAGRGALLSDPVLVEQLRNRVEYETAKPPPRVDHPKNEHDDVANAACGALMLALRRGSVATN